MAMLVTKTKHCTAIKLDQNLQHDLASDSNQTTIPPQRQPLSTTTTTTLHHTCDGDSATDETESSHQDCTMNHPMSVAAKRTPDATTTGEQRTLCLNSTTSAHNVEKTRLVGPNDFLSQGT